MARTSHIEDAVYLLRQQISRFAGANASRIGRLPVGGSTSPGFVGGYSGPNVLPTAFTLNGTLCTTR